MKNWIYWIIFVLVVFNGLTIYQEVKTVVYDIKGITSISKQQIDSLHKCIDSLNVHINGLKKKLNNVKTTVNDVDSVNLNNLDNLYNDYDEY